MFSPGRHHPASRRPPALEPAELGAIEIVKMNVEPGPSSDSAQMRPPCDSTTWRDIESPRPVPPAAADARPVHLVEPLEDAGQIGPRHADARVADPDP